MDDPTLTRAQPIFLYCNGNTNIDGNANIGLPGELLLIFIGWIRGHGVVLTLCFFSAFWYKETSVNTKANANID